MPLHDIVIRGGTIVDGTGAAAFTGDVAIDGERIAAVGGKAGPARQVIDADGMLVTPGWVDVHTHYDGQATWHPILAPSSWHGVTTILFGNCGVGFAPVRPHHRADAPIDATGGAGRRLWLYDIAHQRTQDDTGRNGVGPVCRDRGIDRNRRRAG